VTPWPASRDERLRDESHRAENNTIKANVQLIYLFNIFFCNYGLALKGKNYKIITEKCVYFIRENCAKLTSGMQVSFVNEAPDY
jgi:hypothetical protein